MHDRANRLCPPTSPTTELLELVQLLSRTDLKEYEMSKMQSSTVANASTGGYEPKAAGRNTRCMVQTEGSSSYDQSIPWLDFSSQSPESTASSLKAIWSPLPNVKTQHDLQNIVSLWNHTKSGGKTYTADETPRNVFTQLTSPPKGQQQRPMIDCVLVYKKIGELRQWSGRNPLQGMGRGVDEFGFRE